MKLYRKRYLALAALFSANLYAGVKSYNWLNQGDESYMQVLKTPPISNFERNAAMIAYSPVQAQRINLDGLCRVPLYQRDAEVCQQLSVPSNASKAETILARATGIPAFLIAASIPVAQLPGTIMGMYAGSQAFKARTVRPA